MKIIHQINTSRAILALFIAVVNIVVAQNPVPTLRTGTFKRTRVVFTSYRVDTLSQVFNNRIT